jgi:nicotinamide-nucleotide amidase
MAEEKPSRNEEAPEELLAHLLMEKSMTLSTAESCTGGLIAAKLTSVPGVSAVYAGGFVTYATKEKTKMLGVPARVLK